MQDMRQIFEIALLKNQIREKSPVYFFIRLPEESGKIMHYARKLQLKTNVGVNDKIMHL